MSIMDWKKETKGNPIYPKGSYKVSCKSFERTTAKTGTPQLRWDATIVSPDEHAGRVFVMFTPLTEKSLWKVANLIAGFGVDTTKLDKMDTESEGFTQILQACVGRTSFWRNEDGQDNQGNPRNNVVDFVRDPNQPVLEFESGLDIPDFVK